MFYVSQLNKENYLVILSVILYSIVLLSFEAYLRNKSPRSRRKILFR